MSFFANGVFTCLDGDFFVIKAEFFFCDFRLDELWVVFLDRAEFFF